MIEIMANNDKCLLIRYDEPSELPHALASYFGGQIPELHLEPKTLQQLGKTDIYPQAGYLGRHFRKD